MRFGIRRPNDPLIEDSLKVIDAVLKVDTPNGPCWKRYNHDGYGQRADGTSFKSWGVGHAWPLLMLERATYELAAGRNIDIYLRAAEGFATGIGLFPEQIWDMPDIPEQHMFFGKATGAAIPLLWAHAEYVGLLRSMVDNKVFDCIDPVFKRYCNDNPRRVIEIWKINRQVQKVPAGALLRVGGVLALCAALDRRRMDNAARHQFHADFARHRVRRHSSRRRPEGAAALHLQVAGRQPVARQGLRCRSRAAQQNCNRTDDRKSVTA